ncbi:MAG: FecR domain-containing protein [Balneolaceae bacterium]|nr:FecR domain-containing protein [Balneolaceae bacterium]
MDNELLQRYLSGLCNETEIKQVEGWLEESTEHRKMMNEYQKIWNVSPGKRIEVDSHEAWDSFSNRYIGTPEQQLHSDPQNKVFQVNSKHVAGSRKKSAARLTIYSIAAAAVLVIAFLFYSNNVTPDTSVQPKLVSQEITTDKGQRTTVRLSDGTRIHLNAESKLSVPQDYMADRREVHLQGEAYFEVITNKQKPFFVHTGESVTRVLGTKFNVTAYPADENVQVVVAEGKVALGAGKDDEAPEVQLTTKQKGTISKNGKILASKISRLDIYLDWSKGNLTFHDAPMDEVKNKLERWYDINVVIDDRVLVTGRRLTGSFQDVSMKSVLNSIALSLELSYTQDGRTITFKIPNQAKQ